MACSTSGFKIGDTYPFIGRIVAQEDGVDVTDTTDFSLWAVSCQYRDHAGAVVYEVPSPWVTGPILDCSLPAAVCATLTAGVEYRMDVRVKDENGIVRSTATRRIKFDAAVSDEP